MKKLCALTMVAGLAAGAYAGDCPGDCNGDGTASILDFVCFQGEWQAQTAAGDCDGNGIYNILDFVCFQAAFQDFQNGGCDGPANPIDEDFDDYDLGNICGQGPWEPWDLNPDVCGEVSDAQAVSGANSLFLVGSAGPAGDDVVIVPDTIEGGQWTLKCQTFVPEDMTGQGWIIMLNTYSHGGAKNWSLQVRLNADFGTVESDFDGGIALLTKGEWVEFVAHIDLDADTQDYFYGGEQFVFGKSWIDGVSGGGLPQIQCLDMYAGEPGNLGATGVYFDDIVLSPGLN